MELILYLITIFVLLGIYLFAGIYMLLKYFKSQKSEAKTIETRLFLLYGLFFLFLMIGRVFLFIFDFFLTEFDISDITDLEFLIWKLGIGSQIIGYSFLFYLMEHRIFKGKDYYILLILYYIFFIIGMAATNIEDAGIYTFIPPALSLFIPIAYLYIGFKSERNIRRKAFLIFFGFILIFIAMSLDIEPILVGLMELLSLGRIGVYVIINIVKSVAILLIFFGFK